MRRWHFSLRSMLLLITIAALLLVPATRMFRTWQSTTRGTITVRVTSSGTVKFGKELSMEQCLPALTREVQVLRSVGLKPILLIEAYSNTKQSDVESLREIGKKAGFDSVETERLAWPEQRDDFEEDE